MAEYLAVNPDDVNATGTIIRKCKTTLQSVESNLSSICSNAYGCLVEMQVLNHLHSYENRGLAFKGDKTSRYLEDFMEKNLE